MQPSPRVAVLIEASNAYGRGLLAGVHFRRVEPLPTETDLPLAAIAGPWLSRARRPPRLVASVA